MWNVITVATTATYCIWALQLECFSSLWTFNGCKRLAAVVCCTGHIFSNILTSNSKHRGKYIRTTLLVIYIDSHDECELHRRFGPKTLRQSSLWNSQSWVKQSSCKNCDSVRKPTSNSDKFLFKIAFNPHEYNEYHSTMRRNILVFSATQYTEMKGIRIPSSLVLQTLRNFVRKISAFCHLNLS